MAGGTTTAAVANNTAARLETAGRVALSTMAVRTGEPLLGGYLGPDLHSLPIILDVYIDMYLCYAERIA